MYAFVCVYLFKYKNEIERVELVKIIFVVFIIVDIYIVRIEKLSHC